MNKFHYVTLCLHSAVHLRAPSISKSSSRLKLDTTIRNWLPVPFKIRSILVMLSKQYFYFVSEPIGCVDIFAAAPRGLRYSALNPYLRSFRRQIQRPIYLRQSLQCSALCSNTKTVITPSNLDGFSNGLVCYKRGGACPPSWPGGRRTPRLPINSAHALVVLGVTKKK